MSLTLTVRACRTQTQPMQPKSSVAAALERYQASWDELLGSWFDRDRCRAVNAELDHLRKLMVALPRLSADWVEVVMRHAQLLLSARQAHTTRTQRQQRWPPCGENTARRSKAHAANAWSGSQPGERCRHSAGVAPKPFQPTDARFRPYPTASATAATFRAGFSQQPYRAMHSPLREIVHRRLPDKARKALSEHCSRRAGLLCERRKRPVPLRRPMQQRQGARHKRIVQSGEPTRLRVGHRLEVKPHDFDEHQLGQSQQHALRA